MRPRRPLLLSLLSPLALLACGGNTQGYYGPCDEPLGLAAGCPAEGGEEEASAADACMKLATCGVIYADDEPEMDDQPTQFQECVQIIQESLGDDPGALLLTCIDESTCADLSQTDIGGDPPDPNPANVERVVGWCGRFDP